MPSLRPFPLLAGVFAAALALAAAPAVRAEAVVTLFAGKAEIPESDLRLTLPGGTDLRFENVSWDDDSFEQPPYWGLRAAWWLPRRPRWGLALDVIHAKAILDVARVVPVRGRRRGVAVDGAEPVGEDLPAFQMSHGLDLVVLEALRRWGSFGGERPGVSYFAGAGGGVAVPHVEARANGVETTGYQVAGPSLQALLGLDTALDEHVGITLEARATWIGLDADLAGGGGVETDLWLLQLAVGLSLRD